jgi:hypothetical protein
VLYIKSCFISVPQNTPFWFLEQMLRLAETVPVTENDAESLQTTPFLKNWIPVAGEYLSAAVLVVEPNQFELVVTDTIEPDLHILNGVVEP